MKNKKSQSKWNSMGGGMSKHRKSGVAHNHANTISRVREENERLKKEREMREKRKGQMFDSVADAFKKR